MASMGLQTASPHLKLYESRENSRVATISSGLIHCITQVCCSSLASITSYTPYTFAIYYCTHIIVQICFAKMTSQKSEAVCRIDFSKTARPAPATFERLLAEKKRRKLHNPIRAGNVQRGLTLLFSPGRRLCSSVRLYH